MKKDLRAVRSEGRTNAFCGWWLLFPLRIVYTIPIALAYYGPAVLHPVMISSGVSAGRSVTGEPRCSGSSHRPVGHHPVRGSP